MLAAVPPGGFRLWPKVDTAVAVLTHLRGAGFPGGSYTYCVCKSALGGCSVYTSGFGGHGHVGLKTRMAALHEFLFVFSGS